MKFRFKIQKYQTDAVENICKVFAGQPSQGNAHYRMDLGTTKKDQLRYSDDDLGYRNQDIALSQDALLKNIREIQLASDIKQSDNLSHDMGACSLDIEMETGTGKTYVYIKSMFELNKRYGWSKFIVVVPSIAIREGVKKSFEMLEDHFMECYGKKARFFIYSSDNLEMIDNFSSGSGIHVMIINAQAFNKSLKEDGKSKESLIIYSERDEFGSRRPIDVISANHPIIIVDEPQKMEGAATQKGLRNFKPLFLMNFSATHKTKHNLIYALDALDAYKQKLVKKIQVKGFEIKNLKGNNGYLYLDDIVLSTNSSPRARLNFEIKTKSGSISRVTRILSYGDDLQKESDLHEYDGYVISDINAFNDTVTFTNGEKIRKGEVIGDSNEKTLQRLQIRETIASHFEKERILFDKGIKCLSLFFIDEVANYKYYDETGEHTSYLGKIFEEEYQNFLNDNLDLYNPEYRKYLLSKPAETVHKGYFSIDPKGHAINGKEDKKTGLSDDISAYDLILRNKERLLSFEEPVRFIFSHSALREGWDNPNVFQICTLRHANSATAKRQEVGRGLRLCVDKQGNRQDLETLGEDIHSINKLTVIANESYKTFVDQLQKETKEILRDRPTKATVAYFTGKIILDAEGKRHTVTEDEATMVSGFLMGFGYTNKEGTVSESYKTDFADGKVIFPPAISNISEGLNKLIQATYDESLLEDMYENGNETKTPDNTLNENFKKKEFQELWERINHQYVYTVHYDSKELIKNAANSINQNLTVNKLKYIVTTGEQNDVDSYEEKNRRRQTESEISTSSVKFDLVGEIAKGATLTRKTVVEILKLTSEKLIFFKYNPQEYISNVINLIKEQKATMIVQHIGYSLTDGKYDSDIFTMEKRAEYTKAYKAKKHITDYVFTDGSAEKSVERKFAEELDLADEVVVYAKLPRSFHIPTPVGNYSPDWAIAFQKGTVKHIFFVAETKGNTSTMELRKIESAKINCAKKLFNEISSEDVRYAAAATYDDLLKEMSNIP